MRFVVVLFFNLKSVGYISRAIRPRVGGSDVLATPLEEALARRLFLSATTLLMR